MNKSPSGMWCVNEWLFYHIISHMQISSLVSSAWQEEFLSKKCLRTRTSPHDRTFKVELHRKVLCCDYFTPRAEIRPRLLTASSVPREDHITGHQSAADVHETGLGGLGSTLHPEVPSAKRWRDVLCQKTPSRRWLPQLIAAKSHLSVRLSVYNCSMSIQCWGTEMPSVRCTGFPWQTAPWSPLKQRANWPDLQSPMNHSSTCPCTSCRGTRPSSVFLNVHSSKA